jgi:hypothetical protein
VPEPFAGGKAIWRLILTIHFHVTERLIEIWSTNVLQLHVFVVWTGTNLTFYKYI